MPDSHRPTNTNADKVEELCRSIDIAAHKVFPAEQNNIEERLNEVVRDMEAPFWNPAVIVHDTLMKLVRSSDTQVVLDGMGGDELFAGYDRHLSHAVRDNFHRLHVREAAGNIIGMHTKHGRFFLKEILRALLPQHWPDRLETALSSLRGQQQPWHAGLFRTPLCPPKGIRSTLKGTSHLDGALKRDLLLNNVPRWLHMGDGISMANSVVCRSPLLDFRLVEFAFSLDNSLKIRKGETKYILRETKRDQLPSSIVNDSRKIQFSGPGEHWLRGPLKAFALSLKDEKNTRLAAFLHKKALSAVIDDFYQAKHANVTAMWRLLNAETWLRSYF